MWLTYIANTLLSSTWIFFIIFGNVKEAQQLNNLQLICTEEAVHNKELHYFSDDCAGDKPYNISYHILSLTGSILAFSQIYYFTRHLFYYLVAKRIFDVAFLFKPYIINSSFVTPLVASLYAYHYLQYAVFFCHKNQTYCEHRPFLYDIVKDVYLSMVIILSIYLITQITAISMFFYFFFNIHYVEWRKIKRIEDMLCNIKEHFESSNITLNFMRTPHIKQFIRKWRERQEEDIEDEIHQKAVDIIYLMKKEILKEEQKKQENTNVTVDINDYMYPSYDLKQTDFEELEKNKIPVYNTLYASDKPIYFEDKDYVIYKESINKSSFLTKEIWDFLTHYGLYDKCCVLSVKYALYYLFFLRKEFANGIFTDLYIITAIFKYVSFFLYPVGIVAITRVFGYENGFGTGVDLFKTYLVGASFIISKIMLPLRFLGLMITQRPFNMGDIIMLGNDTFKVKSMNMSHTFLEGSYFMVVPNDIFIGANTINLTRMNITDSFEIQVPITVRDDELNADIACHILEKYNALYPEDIKMDSTRCGWVATNNGTKTMKFNWRYHFKIHNRSRLNCTRRQLYNYICENCSEIMAKHYININIAGGGGFNNFAGKKALEHF